MYIICTYISNAYARISTLHKYVQKVYIFLTYTQEFLPSKVAILVHVYAHVHTYTYTHTHIHPHTYTHIHTHTHPHTHQHTHTLAHTYTQP